MNWAFASTLGILLAVLLLMVGTPWYVFVILILVGVIIYLVGLISQFKLWP